MRVILVAFAISAAFAQQVEFDVASVRPAAGDPFGGRAPIAGPVAEMLGFEGGPGSKTPGRIHYSGVSLKMLLARAYDMRPYQIAGPGWMETERYEIEAKYPPETKAEAFRLMLQALLTERFQLVLHRETREVSRYRLVAARGGPKLSPAQAPPVYKDDEERKAGMRKRAMEMVETMQRRAPGRSYRIFREGSATMARLAQNLSGNVDRPVTDDTGIEGEYSFSLEWVPEPSAAAGDDALPSIFTALQEQLGLKLEPEKGPVEYLVIERAEKKPVAN